MQSRIDQSRVGTPSLRFVFYFDRWSRSGSKPPRTYLFFDQKEKGKEKGNGGKKEKKKGQIVIGFS